MSILATIWPFSSSTKVLTNFSVSAALNSSFFFVESRVMLHAIMEIRTVLDLF